jgi:hypothetical protein
VRCSHYYKYVEGSRTELGSVLSGRGILQLNSYFDETNGAMIITLKINKDEAQAIIATFQRYDYQLVQYFGKTPLHNDIEAHYHHLMNYLDV